MHKGAKYCIEKITFLFFFGIGRYKSLSDLINTPPNFEF